MSIPNDCENEILTYAFWTNNEIPNRFFKLSHFLSEMWKNQKRKGAADQNYQKPGLNINDRLMIVNHERTLVRGDYIVPLLSILG